MSTAAAALRASRVPPFHAMEMARRAAELEAAGRTIMHLEFGQPAMPAPPSARAAVVDAMRTGRFQGYTTATGLTPLRERIARHYDEWYGVDVPVERILVVSGASAGFTIAFLALFDAGQRVGVLEPGYPCYRNVLLAFDVEPVPIVVDHTTRWAPTAERLDAAGPLDGLIVASPSNPTGTVLPTDALQEISGWAAARGAHVIADEIYHGITYGAPAPTVLATAPDTFIVASFSKYFCMTGWRLGWVVVPPGLTEVVERLQQNLYICAPSISQVAGLAAFNDQELLDAEVARYAVNRQVLSDGLRAAGITQFAEADGAFYIYADVSHVTDDSVDLANRWLRELHVATTPGLDFDLDRGRRFVRFSYAGALDQIEMACGALARWRP